MNTTINKLKGAYLANRRNQLNALIMGDEPLFNYYEQATIRAERALTGLVGEIDAAIEIIDCEAQL